MDLRDGNQALIVPMSLEEKLEFFQMLVKIGFKEIEVGFPAASDTEYEFLRTLIEKNMIPEDVTVQAVSYTHLIMLDDKKILDLVATNKEKMAIKVPSPKTQIKSCLLYTSSGRGTPHPWAGAGG